MPNATYPSGDPVARARHVPVGDQRIRVVEAGSDGAFPIVMLHGWGAWAYNFRGLPGPLVAAGYRTVAPDLPGHGWSSTNLPRGAWTRQAMIDWTRRLLDALGVRQCVLVGQSLGGAIALDCAGAMPDRVRAAVLLAPIGFTPVRRVWLARMFPWVTFPTTPRWIVARILRDIYGARGRWTERDLDEYWTPLRRPDVVRAILQSVREFDFSLRDASLFTDCLLVIRFGELDGLIPQDQAMQHARTFTNADAAVLPAVGHVPADEIPLEMAQLVMQVANDVVASTPDARGRRAT